MGEAILTPSTAASKIKKKKRENEPGGQLTYRGPALILDSSRSDRDSQQVDHVFHSKML